MNTREAARRLGVSRSAVSRMVARGELLPAVKMPGIRGAFMFRAADVNLAADRRAEYGQRYGVWLLKQSEPQRL